MPDPKPVSIPLDQGQQRHLRDREVVDEIGKALEGIIYGKVTVTVRDSRVVQLERLTFHRQA